mgnify:CR=1 FL=1
MTDNAAILQANRMGVTPPKKERDRGSPAKIAAGVEQRQQTRIAQEAEAEWQRFASSPQGKATLLSNRDKLQDQLESQRAQSRGGLTSAQLAAQSRKQTRQRYIAAFVKSKNEEEDRGNSTRLANQARVNGGSGGAQGAAAKPVVVAKTQVAKGTNTNTKEENLNYIETKNSEFSTGERTKGIFNIGRFRAEVSGADSILPTHSFLVVFAPMPWAIQRYPQAGNLDSILTMRCDNVILPSINLLQEQNIRRYGFGPVENVAYGINVGDFTLQFIVDKNAFVVQFFEEWLNKIVNRDSFGGANMNNVLPGGRKPYEIAYKDTYACSSINVFVYDRSQNNVMEYNIYDAFPTGIQSMNMSWSEENELMKLNITFSFTDVRIKQSPAKNKKEGAGAFGSHVDFQNALVNGPKMTDAELKSFLSSNPLVYAGSLTDLTKETITIGDGARTRGSVTPVQLNTTATSQTADVQVQKNVSTLNVRINPPA